MLYAEEQVCQREDYFWDTNPYDANFSQNASGRLTAIRYQGGPSCNTTFTEMYSYNVGGAALKKRLRVTRSLEDIIPPYGSQGFYERSVNLDATYTYDNEGRMLTQ